MSVIRQVLPAHPAFCATPRASLRLSSVGPDLYSSSALIASPSAGHVRTRCHAGPPLQYQPTTAGDAGEHATASVDGLFNRHNVSDVVIGQVTFQHAHTVTSDGVVWPVRQIRASAVGSPHGRSGWYLVRRPWPSSVIKDFMLLVLCPPYAPGRLVPVFRHEGEMKSQLNKRGQAGGLRESGYRWPDGAGSDANGGALAGPCEDAPPPNAQERHCNRRGRTSPLSAQLWQDSLTPA